MISNKNILLVALSLFSAHLFSEQFFLPEHEPLAKSYVKSVNIAGFELLNNHRGTWVHIPEGSYSGDVECIVDDKVMKVDMSFEAKGDATKLYIFTADHGCGFIAANQK